MTEQVRKPGRKSGPQPVGRPVGTSNGDTRQLIVEAAIEAFGEHGYDGASMRDISARVGLTHGTTYFYFSSKPELYRAAYEEAVGATFRYFAEIIDTDSANSLPEAFSAILDAASQRIADKPAYSQLALRYRSDFRISEEDGRARPRVTDAFLDKLTSKAVQNGEVAPEDEEATTEALSALLWGLTTVGLRNDKARQQAVDGLKRLIVGGFISPTTPD